MVVRSIEEDESREAIREYLDADPVTNAFIISRLARWLDGAAPLSRLVGEFWIVETGNRIDAVLSMGAHLVPTMCAENVISKIASKVSHESRRSSSIVGPAQVIHPLWDQLQATWGSPRAIREEQPLLVLRSKPLVDPDLQVRAVEPVELSLIFPAAVEMFTEEVGISPMGIDGGASFRSRLAELIVQGRAFAHIENGKVLFKAEIGISTSGASQIQGVWTAPERRGEGIGSAGMAAVVIEALRMSDSVSLYVNSFNTSALRVYEKVGFTRHGTLASVLF